MIALSRPVARTKSVARRFDRLVMVRVVGLAIVATLGASARPPVLLAGTSPFTDIAGTIFEADIDWLFAEGVTVGCSPTLYCPNSRVTRAQMASFLVRMFKLTDGGDIDAFTDDNGTTHEADINRIAFSGISVGCTVTTFCPKVAVRRDEMASFLARAVPLTAGAGDDYFRDDNGTTHEANIDRLTAAGISTGCEIWRFCPDASVTRGQMAGFLHRVVRPLAPPPHPAPSGPLTFYVATSGSDVGNACLVEGDPCRTIRNALGIALDGDTINVGPGTFAEENLTLDMDMTIAGDPGGATTIDASGGGHYRIFTITWQRKVRLSNLILTGGRAAEGGAVRIEGFDASLTVSNSTIKGNSAGVGGGVFASQATVTITDTTFEANHASYGGGGVAGDYQARLSITGSTVSGNSTGGRGGGLLGGASLIVAESLITGNVSLEDGGGVANNDSLTIRDSTISDNRSDALGGGIDHGGFIDSSFPGSPATIANSTITGNTSSGGGGGSFFGSTLSITNSTITGNGASLGAGVLFETLKGAFRLRNSIVAGNASTSAGEVEGTINTRLASIVGVPAGRILADILDPAGLATNGGPTQTIALTDSVQNPALGKGDAATCAAVPISGLDQRGQPRDPPCDIGAYELQP